MPLAKSYTRTRGGDIRHRKEEHKEDQAGRQAGKFADNEIRDKRHPRPRLRQLLAGGCKQIRPRTSEVGTKSFP